MRTSYSIIISLIAAVIITSCKSTAETTVVTGEPQAATSPEQPKTEDSSASFRQLTIGEIHPIRSLDPLFATNTSSQRIIQALYEGLVRLNAQGKPVPAIARKWTVSNDSLTYNFTLRSNVYYHDSEVFTSGTGRRVVAADFKSMFERMAKLDVPSNAAQLFMDIEGFEPYFQEQHLEFLPDQRKIDGIRGITTPNDSTLIIHMENKDPHLIEKLASPYAVIYPMEAVNKSEDRIISHPVGTGPFQLSQRTDDSLFILSKVKTYWRKNPSNNEALPVADRIDFVYGSEQEIFKEFSSGQVQIIPEVGPEMMKSLFDPSGDLAMGYRNQANLYKTEGQITYRILYNEHADIARDAAEAIVNSVQESQIQDDINPQFLDISFNTGMQKAPDLNNLPGTIYTAYTADTFLRTIISQMVNSLKNNQVKLQMLNIAVPNRNTALYSQRFTPYFKGDSLTVTPEELIRVDEKYMGLAAKNVTGIQFNQYPWWLDVTTLNTPAAL